MLALRFWPSILEPLFGAAFGNALWVVRILMVYVAIESADTIMSIILIAAHRQREDVSRLASNPVTNIAPSTVADHGTYGCRDRASRRRRCLGNSAPYVNRPVRWTSQARQKWQRQP